MKAPRAKTSRTKTSRTTTTRATTRRAEDEKPRRTKKKTKRSKETVASLTEMVADRLDRMSDARLPTRRKGLLKHIESQLPSDCKDKAEAVVNGLRRRKIVKITRAGMVEYQ